MLVIPDLGQGTEAVRAFANGDSRFCFTATLDLRLQKRVRIAAGHVDALLDAYNLLNLSYDVEGAAHKLPNVRIPTAVQARRALQLGMRLAS